MTEETRNTTQESAGTGPVLVTSGTGKTGRRVVERLTARGVPVRVGSRRSEIPFDWADESGWEAALSGAEAAYVAYVPDLGAPMAPAAMTAFGEAARRCGVRRLALLSGRGEPDAVVAEEALRAAAGDAELTVVRSAFFTQNFSEGALLDGVLGGELVFPAGDTAEPFVDADDLADVAAAALCGEGVAGSVVELTGPRALTFTEVAAEIAAATGREVRYVALTGAEYEEMLVGFGAPREEAAFLAGLFTSLLDGHNAAVTDGVKRALGRDPKSFTEFAAEAAREGFWSVRP
ncbi:NmrA family transcriptional regulator [Streptomyces sp. NBC_01789]|uniref:NmrA family transcriptional regulator n=1 Tax=Streptomyces sp. NBC_01789 TaxID=2975941 RepID=UPI0022569232|nr:NmrA family transcriptional regulator [Streptomyces sp. NBC_01789]MCX4445736.1 NmrA family transcriptional regulator [Streptomyces sp. NBC_01789]